MNRHRFPALISRPRTPGIKYYTSKKKMNGLGKLEIPVHGSYGVLLLHPRWKAKRAEIIARDGNCCIICTDANELQVHHRQYHLIAKTNGFKPPWDYADNLLITLCKSCHVRGHSKFNVPVIKI